MGLWQPESYELTWFSGSQKVMDHRTMIRTNMGLWQTESYG